MPQSGRPPMLSDLHVVAVLGEGRTVFRVVESDDRASGDFLDSFRSSYELGLPPRRWSPEERFRVIHMGISCFSTARQAERVAVRWGLGDYVAELLLSAGQGFSFARWGSRGHMTVWGDPVKLSETTVGIVRI